MPTKLTSYLTPTTSTGELVKINYKYTAKDGLNYGPLQDDNIDIPSATTTNAGAMSAIDKGRLDSLYNEFGSIQNPGDKLDSLPNNLVTGVDATSRNATSVTINYKQSDLSAASNSYANPITKSQTIPAATQSAAGVMTATDKQNLDVNIPNRITNLDNRVTTEVDRLEELIDSSSSEITNDLNVEIQARKDGDTQLQTNINNLQSTMNTELAKKVGKVTVAGSGNAVTTASISGDTLTLTKGATYNNYVHPAGSAPSKASGFYKFSTDSTSHVASVTAVAKSDITALGIPGQDTTYGNATQSTSGLMSAADKTKLDGISTGANKYVHPTGEAANKALGLYKVATDATSHVKQVAAVTKKDITDLGIADTSSTLRLVYLGSKEDYEHVVILLWKDGEVATNRIDGLFYTVMDGSTRRQAAEAHLWFSRWAAGFEYKFILNTSQQGSGFSLVTCTYNGAKWWGLRHINDQAVNFYFDGSMSSQINPTIVKYYNKNTSTVLNAEINSSVTNEASKLSRFDVNGDPYALLSEVNTKVSKAGDTMTGNLTVGNTNSYHCVLRTAGVFTIKATPTVGGWNRGYEFVNANDTVLAKFGAYGSGQNFNYCYIGTSHDGNNVWQRWNSSGSTVTVPLTTAAITSSDLIKANRISTANIKIECNNDGTLNGRSSEINNYNSHLYLQHNSATNLVCCDGGGKVGIGVSTPTEKLHVAGNVLVTGKVSAAGGFFKESDARLKTDIKPLCYTLDQICSIPTVSFIMNDQKQIGTVAQDLEELGFEDIVTESDTLKTEVKNPEQFESFTKDGEEYVKVKKVEYEMLGVLAIEGVKMLKDEIEKLKAEIETLKNKQHE